MRIFVYNCNTYIGKALVKELRKDERGFNRIFGCQTAAGGAPPTVKRLSTRDDPKKAKRMEEAIRSCSVVILDLFNCTLKDLYFVLQALKVDPKSNPPRRMGDIKDKDDNRKESMTFILISSAMVWANTKLEDIVVPVPEPVEGEPPADGEGEPPPPSGPPTSFNESFFEQRTPIPGSRYEQWKEMENLVRTCFSLEGSQVKAFTVGAGVIYGDGEETFTQLFKDAWLGTKNHTITSPGTNIVPTCHVRDVARLVRQVCYNQELDPATRPYFLAVDKVDEDATAPTQAEIIKGIVGEVNGPRDIPMVNPPTPPPPPAEESEEAAPAAPVEIPAPEPGSPEALMEATSLNLKMEPSSLMLGENFEWHCPGGLLKNIRMVAEEFSTERQLRAMRVIIAGPPASGKNTLCKAVSDHFNIPLLEMNLQDPDGTRKQLLSEVCRYRGYVLNAKLSGWKEVEQLFCKDYELPVDPDAEDAPPPPEPGEDGELPPEPEKKYERRLSEEGIVPEFAILLQASEDLCRARYNNAKKGTADKFVGHITDFKSRNLVDGQSNFADFFQDTAKIPVFNLPIAGKSEEDMFESTRIFMEKGEGRPFNYLPTGEEVANEILSKQLEKEELNKQKAEVLERQVSSGVKVSEAVSKRHLERLKIIGSHEAERNQLDALSLREYLMRYAVPNLTEGLIETCRVMPENPVDYLANYLEQHAAREQSEN